jgi:pyruvate/2-oxoglutarate dehydrogenase complex dihydrolipoamide acyltransferase (E2) component
MKTADCVVLPFSAAHLPQIDYMEEARRKHTIHGLFEVDVTRVRSYLRDYKARTGEALSFTGFIATCVARAVDQNKRLHAYRNWRNQLVLFDEVDVNIIVEREASDTRMGTPYVIRAANTKTFRQVHQEIRAAQATPAKAFKRVGGYRFIPTFIQRLFWRILLHNPHWMKRIAGTVSITAVGMFGKGAGWGLPISGYTLTVTLGGMAEKPGVFDGYIEIREYLSVTITVDHDIVDGAPAARFIQQLKELIESGYGLEGT